MKQVLFDSDVLLDILAQRQPFVIASAQALNTVMKKQVQGFISGHAVTNIFYILRRQIGSESARKLIENLLQHIQIASVTNQVIHQALQSPIKDFEDAVTSAAAMSAGLEIIVTRNQADFVASLVPAMLPEEFLKMLSE
ncbi:MAG: PIN domain-containing protein [Aphanizomenon flos-aquae KM1D3_PB]|uniref:PIN domain-containing protein n=1 Tax=Aphanizomenon flos-aquae TaxID=1176 RepID=UPI000541F820|nr:PIN domain-containing protein [Aphanizomenon flos-aquae]KHG41917.1 nucleic-acid-binding protein, contains PIN domain protein [Aphanizomenon flos-aquae 2012/KM1/D3]MDM3859127.1 PIN domain-containing protein [Aphanizomenon gracile PMC644.10]QSV73914.1 MAG: PIN domain-containing protein [Aphanizomenon flos-aquae KM1D3_PB]